MMKEVQTNLRIEQEYYGEEYGRFTKESAEAVRLTHDLDGVILEVTPDFGKQIQLASWPGRRLLAGSGRGAGWLVYAPESRHRPTVTEGRALVLYLLPQGRIDWT